MKAHSFWYEVYNKILNSIKLKITLFKIFGGRQSGKTTSFFLFLVMCYLYLPPHTVGCVALRNSAKDVDKFMLDCMEMLDYMKVPYKHIATKKIIRINNQDIRFYGSNSNKKTVDKWSGLPRLNVKYLFVWMEEAFEFSPTDMSGISGTFRNANKDGQILFVYTMNPWSKTHWLVQDMLSKMMWNPKIMSDENGPGYQIGVFPVKTATGGTTYELIQYSNWRCNRENVTPEAINGFKQMWSYAPRLAEVSDWGAPGYEEGRIYSHVLHKIGPARVRNGQQYLIAGMDYGWGTSDRAGVTVAVFGSATLEDGVDMFGEYIQDNRQVKKDVNQTCFEIVSFYRKCMGDFMYRTNARQPYPLHVRVDNSATGVIQVLQNEAATQGVNSWLTFGKCVKQPIQDRVELTLWLMGTSKFRMSPNMKLLKSEFESAFYEDIETQKRSNTNDHAINAYEYAIEPLLYKFNNPITMRSSTRMLHKSLGI